MPVASDTRRTGLIAKVIDNNLNSWEDFAGLDINVPATYQSLDTTEGDTDPNHWSYRGQASMCVLANGNIVRVRIGDWTATTERRIQRQIITDPTDPSQWQTWAWLAYGNNWSVAIERDDAAPAGYRIYHSKTDYTGLYMDNVLIYSGGAAGLPCIRIKPVSEMPNFIYFALTDQAADGNREISWFYIANTLSPSVVADCATFHNYHQDVAAISPGGSGVFTYRFRALPADGAERDPNSSDVLLAEVITGANVSTTFWSDFNTFTSARTLKGPSARAGFKRIDNMFVTKLTDPDFGTAHYLFYTEQHMDAYGNVLSNRKSPLFFSRATLAYGTPFYFSAPIPIGFSVWGFAGVVESGDYVYLAGNGRVLRSLIAPQEIDITDYVISGGYEIPRDNGKGTGTLVCANPGNLLGAQLGLTSENSYGVADREVQFGLGVKRPQEVGYNFKRDARWWIAGLRKTREENKDHIEIELADFWHRLENPFRDTWAIPGRFEWSDWQPDSANEMPSYTNDTDEFTIYNPAGADPDTVPRLRTVASGDGPQGGTITLYTGFRGKNGYVAGRLWSSVGGLVFRYIDATDYYYVEVNASGTYFHTVFDNDDGIYAQSTATNARWEAGALLEIYYAFNKVEIWLTKGDVSNQIILSVYNDDTPHARSGFVGFWAPTLIEVSNFTVNEPNAKITTRELIKMLLAYVDEQDIEFENDEETLAAPQLDVLWGPQSDLDTPAKAMRALIEASGLNIVFRQDDT